MVRESERIRLPLQVSGIIKTLQEAGFEAYAVGGCVRDSLLGRAPDDWDITTSAKPQQVKALFSRTVDTGIAHGTVTVLQGRSGYEVTTYRIDGAYEDGRHPRDVTFTASLAEDLKRRDFTVNAMAYNEEEGLVDLFGGRADMERRALRCVGNPRERFGEDALRMMRAVRFSAQLDYAIEEDTMEAIRALSGTLSKISAERIRTELVKLLLSGHPERFRTCYETGMTAVFLPEFDWMMETGQNNPHHCYSVGEHALCALRRIRPDQALRLAALLHDVGKPETESMDESGVNHFYGHAAKGAELTRKIMRRLKFDNDTADRVVRLVREHDRKIGLSPAQMRRTVNCVGEDLFPDLFDLKEADLLAQSDYMRDEKREELMRLRALYEKVKEEGDCLSLKGLAVTGRDLIGIGATPGPGLGALLQDLLGIVLENPSCNNRETLLEYARIRLDGGDS
ncbi:MAG TPA: CCA tRNA nucleotidyltransferase [Candidatus Eisenbergiella pullicola]|nr:CCA tRNA nucleotidyltransferase [Candidatus Eisenbergiella pullicola]